MTQYIDYIIILFSLTIFAYTMSRDFDASAKLTVFFFSVGTILITIRGDINIHTDSIWYDTITTLIIVLSYALSILFLYKSNDA